MPSSQSNPNRYQSDLSLTRAAASGSVEKWQTFLVSYAGLIDSVVRRHLPAEGEDEIRSVTVDILEYLHDGALTEYRGRGPLATWLILLARRRAIDFLRSRYGRLRPPRGLERLGEIDQEVFRLYHVEGMSIEIVVHTLLWARYAVSAEDVVQRIMRIEEAVDDRVLSRLDNENSLRRNGGGSVKLLKYLIHLKIEYENLSGDSAPDHALVEQEAGAMAERVRELVAALPPEERRILDLRFNRGLAAREISDELNLGGQREVYTILDRIIRKLRTLVGGGRSGEGTARN